MIMLRAHILLFMLGILLALASIAHAQDREIVFGRGGHSSEPIRSSTGDLGGAWDFIRRTSGPCAFEVFNDPNWSGRSVTYGTNIDRRIRVGATGAQDSGGWRARSVNFRRSDRTECSIILGDSGVRQTFYEHTANISGWSFIQETNGPCVFTVANRDDAVQALQLGEGVVNYGTDFPHLSPPFESFFCVGVAVL
jgi:hypothetical protein